MSVFKRKSKAKLFRRKSKVLNLGFSPFFIKAFRSIAFFSLVYRRFLLEINIAPLIKRLSPER